MEANKVPKGKYLERRKSNACHANQPPMPPFVPNFLHMYQKAYQQHHSYEFSRQVHCSKLITDNTYGRTR
jgi:hypothetical protein